MPLTGPYLLRQRQRLARHRAAAASRSVIISGTARQRIPAASTSSTAPASTVSTSQPSSSPSRSAGRRPRRSTRRRPRRAPCRPSRARARPRRWGRGRRRARPASAIASRMPGTARIVPSATTGLDGGKSDDVGVGDRLQDPGRGLRLLRADRHDRLGRHGGPQPHPVLLEVDRLPLAVHARRRHASRRGRRTSGSAARPASSARTAPR